MHLGSCKPTLDKIWSFIFLQCDLQRRIWQKLIIKYWKIHTKTQNYWRSLEEEGNQRDKKFKKIPNYNKNMKHMCHCFLKNEELSTISNSFCKKKKKYFRSKILKINSKFHNMHQPARQLSQDVLICLYM